MHGLWLQPEPCGAGSTANGDPRQRLADDPLGDERRDVRGADPGRDHLDDVHPDEPEPRRELAARPQEVERRHPTRLGRPGSGREGRVEHVHVDREEHRSLAHGGDRPLDDLADAELADVVHEEARDATLALPGELALARPVASEPDLHVAPAVHVAVTDEAVHRRPVRDLDAEHLGSRVGVGVEVDEPERAVTRGDRPHVRLRDRVVSSEHHGKRAGVDHLAHERLDRRVRPRVRRPGSRGRRRSRPRAAARPSRRGPRDAAPAGSPRRGSHEGRTACPAGPTRGRRSARRRWPRRRRRARRGPACTAGRRTSAGRRSPACRAGRAPSTAPAGRARGDPMPGERRPRPATGRSYPVRDVAAA